MRESSVSWLFLVAICHRRVGDYGEVVLMVSSPCTPDNELFTRDVLIIGDVLATVSDNDKCKQY